MPDRPSFARVAAAFLRRDLAEAASYRAGIALRVAGAGLYLTTLFFTARFVNASAGPALARYGGDYFRFVLVGVVLGAFQWAAAGSFARKLREAQLRGTLEAVMATPAPPAAVVFALPLYELAATALQAAAYLAAGAMVLGLRPGWPGLASVALAFPLALAAFAAFGLAGAAVVLLLRRGDPISRLLGSVSVLLGGVLYPTAALPPVLAALGQALPMTHAVEATRRALLSGAGPAEIAQPLGALAAMAAIGLPAGLALFRFALRRARVDGSLGMH